MKLLTISALFFTCALANLHAHPNHIADNAAAMQPVVAIEQTLSILKPDAVSAHHIGDIIARFEKAGLNVIGLRMVKLSKEDASKFYSAHRERPFYPELVTFMSSGPVVVMALEGPDAIAKNRQLIGATDPKKAEAGTIRADYAESMGKNAVHGSDSSSAANEEVAFFFKPNELFNK